MKVIAILLLFAALAFCDDRKYFHYNGTMKVKTDDTTIFGPIFVEFRKTENLTIIAGMSVINRVHTPYELSAKFHHYITKPDGSFVINATCVEARLGKKTFSKLKGIILMEGTWEHAHLTGKCEAADGSVSLEPKAEAVKNPCEFYPMEEAAIKAGYLVGEHSEVYGAANVLSHAVYGYAYLKMSCKDYLKTVGQETKDLKPGVLIIGTDGEHCGIIDREGDKFIHSNPVKKEVTMNPMTMAKDFFKKGFVLKEYKCAKYAF